MSFPVGPGGQAVYFSTTSPSQGTVTVASSVPIPGALYQVIAYNPNGVASNPVTFTITNTLQQPAFLNPGPQTFVAGGSFSIIQTASSSGITWTISPTTAVTLSGVSDAGLTVNVSTGIPINSPTNYTLSATDSASQTTSQTFTIQNTFVSPAFANPGTQTFTAGGSFSVTQTATNTGPLTWTISPTTAVTLSGASTSGVTVNVSGTTPIATSTYTLTATNPTPSSCVQSFSLTNNLNTPAFANPGTKTFTNGGTFSVTQTATGTGALTWSITPTTGVILSGASTSGVTVTVSSLTPITTRNYTLTALNPASYSCVQTFSITNTVTFSYSFTYFKFTTLSTTGPTGPTSLSGYGTSYPGYGTPGALTLSNGIQVFTVPTTGTYYAMLTSGATYGTSGASGLTGPSYGFYTTLSLTQGDNIGILCGQGGTVPSSSTSGGGGGGGTYIYNLSTSTVLAVSGGPGGAAASGGTTSQVSNMNGQQSALETIFGLFSSPTATGTWNGLSYTIYRPQNSSTFPPLTLYGTNPSNNTSWDSGGVYSPGSGQPTSAVQFGAVLPGTSSYGDYTMVQFSSGIVFTSVYIGLNGTNYNPIDTIAVWGSNNGTAPWTQLFNGSSGLTSSNYNTENAQFRNFKFTTTGSFTYYACQILTVLSGHGNNPTTGCLYWATNYTDGLQGNKSVAGNWTGGTGGKAGAGGGAGNNSYGGGGGGYSGNGVIATGGSTAAQSYLNGGAGVGKGGFGGGGDQSGGGGGGGGYSGGGGGAGLESSLGGGGGGAGGSYSSGMYFYYDLFKDINQQIYLPGTVYLMYPGNANSKVYPPVPILGSPQTVVSQPYGNGTYYSSYSSGDWNGGSPPFYWSFNRVLDCNYDITVSYTGSTSTTVSGSAIVAPWVQLQLPSAITLTAYSFWARATQGFYGGRVPLKWALAGSNDGTTWSMLDDKRTNTTSMSSSGLDDVNPVTYYVTTSTAYSYYRYIVTIAQGNPLEFGHMAFYGY